ncbi:hypothetical protein ACHAQA_000317 [Verticillium albo-atrum]
MSDFKLGDLDQLEYFRRLADLRAMGFGLDAAADALHDAEFDVERAVQYLTEGNPFRMEDVGPPMPPIRPPVPLFEKPLEGWSDLDTCSVSTPSLEDLNGAGRLLSTHEFLQNGKRSKASIQAWLESLRLHDESTAGPSSKKTTPAKRKSPSPEPAESTAKKAKVAPRNLRVGIIGAGFTGMLLAHGLRRYKGIDVNV